MAWAGKVKNFQRLAIALQFFRSPHRLKRAKPFLANLDVGPELSIGTTEVRLLRRQVASKTVEQLD